MIPIVNTDWLGAFTIKIVSNAKAIIQAVILSFKFFIVVWWFNYFYKYIIKNPHSEGFYKKYDNYPVSVRNKISLANLGGGFGILGNEDVESVGLGRTFGTELYIQQKLTKNFYGILAYTWVRSEFQNAAGDFVPSSWDAQHLISFTGGKKFKRNWELGLRWRFNGGNPYTPADVGNSSLITVWEVNRNAQQDFTRLNQGRLSPAHFLDLRVDKKWFFKKWALNIYLDKGYGWNKLNIKLEEIKEEKRKKVKNIKQLVALMEESLALFEKEKGKLFK